MSESPRPPSRLSVFAVVLLIIVTIIGLVLVQVSRPTPATIIIQPPAPSATALPLRVQITGAITHSGSVIELPFGSRVEDLITLAGGFTSDADTSTVNLADFVQDGAHIHIPSIHEPPVPTTEPADQRIRINSATLEELDSLPSIGPVTAQAIITYRENTGRILSIEQLDEIDGIGPSTIEQIEALISFD